jgi:hypothetical protein
MEEVEGIILILSCDKHKKKRLERFGPKKQTYKGWKVIKVIGNVFLDQKYKVIKDFLYIKCEDSYLHLLKKLALSIKYLKELFIIKHGILRCGDDLVFNENNLNKFLVSKKYDFYGKSTFNKNYTSTDLNLLKKIRYDNYMLRYYKKHKNELKDPKHGINLRIDKLKKFLVRPDIWGPHGSIYYLSNKSCDIILNTMEKINYDIFHLDKFTNSYPYIIEDVGVTYIMYYNKMSFINNKNFFDTQDSIAKHTNAYK